MAGMKQICQFQEREALPITALSFYVNNRTISSAETETVPTGAGRVVITSDGDAWMNPNGTAAVPSGDVTDGTGSICLKAGVARVFYVAAGNSLSIIAASGTVHVSYEYFA